MKKLFSIIALFVAIMTITGCKKPEPTTDLTDAEKVAEVKENLTIIGLDAVTEDLALPDSGAYDVVITWSSNYTSVITNAGVVTRPTYSQGDTTVTLQATIKLNDAMDTKSFVATVQAADPNADEAAVIEAKQSLLLTDLDTVVSDLTLTLEGKNSTVVSWASSDTAHLTDAGVVTRPASGEGNASVILTATITKGDASETKEFSVRILEEEASTAYTSIADLHANASLDDVIEVEGVVYFVFDNGYFITDGTNGFGVYTSDLTAQVGDKVSLKGSYAVYNTLYQLSTVTNETIISSGNADTLTPVVKTVAEMLALDSTDRLIHGNLYTVSGTLQQKGDYNNLYIVDDSDEFLISYYSLEDSLTALEGFVNKKIEITVLYYTLHGSNGLMLAFQGDADDVNELTLSDADALAADKAGVENGIPSVALVDFALPLDGANGSVITGWASSDESLITSDGVLGSLPTDTNKTVTLTATISKGNETATISVEVIVPVILDIPTAIVVADDDEFAVEGIVTGMINNGFFIYDSTNSVSMYVYDSSLLDTLSVGDLVTLSGTRDTYNGLNQITGIQSYILVSSDNPIPTSQETTIADIASGNFSGGDYVTITGDVTVEGSFFNAFINDGSGNKVEVYYRSNDSHIKDQEGLNITVNVYVYQDNSGTWRVLYTGDAAGVTVNTLTDAEAVIADKTTVESSSPSITISDLVLPTTGANESVISGWASSDTSVLDNDGKIVAIPTDSNKTITLTATVTKGTETANISIDVIVPVVLDIPDALALSDGDLLAVSGIVFGVFSDGFFIYDNDGTNDNYMFVYDSSAVDNVAVGDNVTGAGERASYSGLQQITNIESGVVNSTGNDLPVAVEATTSGILNGDYPNGTIVTIRGTVSIEGDHSNAYIDDGSGNKVEVYYKSNQADVKLHDGQLIELEVVVYHYQKGRVLFVQADADITVSPILTDAYKVQVAYDALDLGDLSAVIGDVTLPTTGAQTATISWSTSDIAVIGADGTVIAQTSGDATATLTATIDVNGVTLTKDFNLTVLDLTAIVGLSVTDALAEDDGDVLYVQGIVSSFNGTYGLFIQDADGTAIYVNNDFENVVVGDSILIKGVIDTYTDYDNDQRKLINPVLLRNDEGSNLVSVNDTVAIKDIFDNHPLYSSKRITLTNVTINKVNDTHGNIEIVSGSGKMVINIDDFAPYAEAIWNDGDVISEMTFTVYDISFNDLRLVAVELPELTEAQKVIAAADMLDVPTSTTEDLTLLTAVAEYGATITWSTTDAGLITDLGVVTRPLEGEVNGLVTLTATITVGTTIDTVDYVITVPAIQPVTSGQDLFFSQYGDGDGGSCKFVEIYNPTTKNVDLSTYKIIKGGNGTSFEDSADIEELTGTLAPGAVLVIGNPACFNGTDSLSVDAGFPQTGIDYISSTVVGYINGDDALGFYNNSVLIDVIGENGTDPGSSWAVGNGNTTDGTTANVGLIRIPTVESGETDWAVAAMQWIVLADDRDYSDVGSHTVTPAS